MADSSEEKTETPTDKRRSDAREKGNVMKSAEINSALVLLAGLMMLYWFSSWMFDGMSAFITQTLSLISHPYMDIDYFMKLMTRSLYFISLICFPICAVIMATGIIVNLLQVGFLLSFEPLMPKLEKLSLISGFKRLLSIKSVVEMLKNIAKLTVIGAVAYFTIKGEFGKFIGLWDASPAAIWNFAAMVAFNIVLRIALVLLIISILDYFYQRYEYEKQLKMTKQEVKEERKQMDGDPQIKSRIRSLQREMARRRMIQEIPKATVVITNPTYIAIAIRYEPDTMQTPKVVAKGKRIIAEKIKKTALELGIPIIEDKPLARAMYDKVEPGSDIPIEFFTAVAEVLAYVYRLKNRTAA
jgi:flagellar biosynthetic protein FlhB